MGDAIGDSRLSGRSLTGGEGKAAARARQGKARQGVGWEEW